MLHVQPSSERAYLVAVARELTSMLETFYMSRCLAKDTTHGLQDCTEVICIAFTTLHKGIFFAN